MLKIAQDNIVSLFRTQCVPDLIRTSRSLCVKMGWPIRKNECIGALFWEILRMRLKVGSATIDELLTQINKLVGELDELNKQEVPMHIDVCWDNLSKVIDYLGFNTIVKLMLTCNELFILVADHFSIVPFEKCTNFCRVHMCGAKKCTRFRYRRDDTLLPFCKDHLCCEHTCTKERYVGKILCKDHLCKISKCDQCVVFGAYHCEQHICQFDGCFSPRTRSLDSQYCTFHECGGHNCSKLVVVGKKKCQSHMCKIIGCENEGELTENFDNKINNKNSDYCREHKCVIKVCANARIDELTCCNVHLCGQTGCTNAQMDGKILCSDHACCLQNCPKLKAIGYESCMGCMCKFRWCYRPKQNNTLACMLHTCKYPTCNGTVIDKIAQFCDQHNCKYNGCLKHRSGSIAFTTNLPRNRFDGPPFAGSYCNDHATTYVEISITFDFKGSCIRTDFNVLPSSFNEIKDRLIRLASLNCWWYCKEKNRKFDNYPFIIQCYYKEGPTIFLHPTLRHELQFIDNCNRIALDSFVGTFFSSRDKTIYIVGACWSFLMCRNRLDAHVMQIVDFKHEMERDTLKKEIHFHMELFRDLCQSTRKYFEPGTLFQLPLYLFPKFPIHRDDFYKLQNLKY